MMKWIASFLDAIFANLFAENRFFVNIADKIVNSVEEFAYNVETGNMDVSSWSHTVERLMIWLPIVFIVCLALDIFVRSRFVRYSYQDEQQAKKSVWWNWQSEKDAVLALEAGSDSMLALNDGVQRVVNETVEDAQQQEEDESDAVQDMQQEQEQPLDAQQEDFEVIDRGPVTSARQNQVRNVAPVAERTRVIVTDIRDQWTVIKGAICFAPSAIKRNARLRKQSMQESSRRNMQKINARIHRERVAKGSREEAEAEALFDVQMQETYVDADFEANETVHTGGIEGYDFAQAAQVMQAAMQQQEAENGAQAQAEEA